MCIASLNLTSLMNLLFTAHPHPLLHAKPAPPVCRAFVYSFYVFSQLRSSCTISSSCKTICDLNTLKWKPTARGRRNPTHSLLHVTKGSR